MSTSSMGLADGRISHRFLTPLPHGSSHVGLEAHGSTRSAAGTMRLSLNGYGLMMMTSVTAAPTMMPHFSPAQHSLSPWTNTHRCHVHAVLLLVRAVRRHASVVPRNTP